MAFAFLWPLVAGFALVGLSSFTAAMGRRWGPRAGERWSAILRTYLGMPLVAIALVLALLEGTPALWGGGAWAVAVGWLLVAAGTAVYVWGHVLLGRITGWPTLHDPLVRRSLYAHVRHPITAGALLASVGALLLRPTQSVALAVAVTAVGLLVQTKLEEMDLRERVPGYREYQREVPWLVPRLPRSPKGRA